MDNGELAALKVLFSIEAETGIWIKAYIHLLCIHCPHSHRDGTWTRGLKVLFFIEAETGIWIKAYIHLLCIHFPHSHYDDGTWTWWNAGTRLWGDGLVTISTH